MGKDKRTGEATMDVVSISFAGLVEALALADAMFTSTPRPERLKRL